MYCGSQSVKLLFKILCSLLLLVCRMKYNELDGWLIRQERTLKGSIEDFSVCATTELDNVLTEVHERYRIYLFANKMGMLGAYSSLRCICDSNGHFFTIKTVTYHLYVTIISLGLSLVFITLIYFL